MVVRLGSQEGMGGKASTKGKLRKFDMKKRIIAMMLGMTMVFTAVGCGDSKSDSTENSSAGSTESSSTENDGTESGSTTENADDSTEDTGLTSLQMGVVAADQVTELCDYSAVPVSLSSDYEVTDAIVEEQVLEILESYGIAVKEVTDHTVVQDGDYVNVDYTGYQDGEAFSGGSATDVYLDVSNNMSVGGTTGFIDGFCDGLLGAEVGSTIDCDVTFPEDYGVDSLNGQTVVFEFVINGIYAAAGLDEIEDSAISEAFGEDYDINTMDELLEFIRTYLESSQSSAVVSEVKSYVVENSTVDIPEDYLAARLKEYEDSFASIYCTDGQTLEEYFETNLGMTLKEAEESLRTYLEEQITVEFAFTVIADEIGVEMDEDEYASYVESLLSGNYADFSTEDELYEYLGVGSIEDGMSYLRVLYRMNKAIDYVAENAVVTYTADED
jgi:FKBP-type peptidyl-prolyl cis-trans isomerase (trigger factor)